eukprot:882937-Rhodomonas_salina.4
MQVTTQVPRADGNGRAAELPRAACNEARREEERACEAGHPAAHSPPQAPPGLSLYILSSSSLQLTEMNTGAGHSGAAAEAGGARAARMPHGRRVL